MEKAKPEELTDTEWLLLQHLYQYAAPFYIGFAHHEFYESQIDKPVFYKMFYRLAGLFYIKLDGLENVEYGEQQTVFYILTRKGKQAVAQDEEDNIFSG